MADEQLHRLGRHCLVCALAITVSAPEEGRGRSRHVPGDLLGGEWHTPVGFRAKMGESSHRCSLTSASDSRIEETGVTA